MGQGRAWLLASNSAKSVLLCFISLHYLWQLINAAGTFECNEDDCKQGYTNWRANYGCICIKVTMHLLGCIYVFYATFARVKKMTNIRYDLIMANHGYINVFSVQSLSSNHF